MLILVLAEAALELIPPEIRNHPAVTKHAERVGKPPAQLLLDRSYHHGAMRGLGERERRGRPDIAHFTLLEALGSPLSLEGELRVYVHTRENLTITVNPSTRLPRNYDRFKGLIEQLYQTRRVPPIGEPLLTLKPQPLPPLLTALEPSRVVGLSRRGRPVLLRDLAQESTKTPRPLFILGGFPAGSFSKDTVEMVDDLVSIDKEGLDAGIVASRLIAAFEEALGLPERRLGP